MKKPMEMEHSRVLDVERYPYLKKSLTKLLVLVLVLRIINLSSYPSNRNRVYLWS